MNKWCDILWVEDEQDVKTYYLPEQFFRVDRQRYMLPLLESLEDEKIFSKYSCAVLDINLNQGFGYYDTLDDEDEKSETDELRAIEKILKNNRILIRGEHNIEKNDETFKKNAGYYVYLYLIHRGMPAERICMLTANKGKNLNLTGKWEDLFKDAGIKPPEAFDRPKQSLPKVPKKQTEFQEWLDKTLTPPYRLRACIVGMSRCAEKFLSDDDETKAVLQNLPRIPLRLSDNTDVADREFISALWQIVQPWESPQKAELAYRTTLKLTRNWLAHLCITELSLLATAFLFGIGLRGLLDKKIPADANEFKLWETELLKLLKDLDAPTSVEKEIGELVMKSCQEFFKRVTTSKNKLKIPLSTEIDKLVGEIGQKSNDIERLDTDLIRNFLHSVYPIYLAYPEGNIPDQNRNRLSITFKLDEKTFYNRRDDIEAKYLAAVKNTLARAVDK